jgi:hypothetical protein
VARVVTVPIRMGVSVHRRFPALLGVLGVCVVAAALIPAAGIASHADHRSRVVLGNSSGPSQDGYGEAHPRRIFNGGDPSGLVMHVHWKHWGSRRATGWGTGLFVWPGLAVAEGFRARARVVAFHLGTCEGHAAYNEVEWFFPAYHQRFHQSLGGQICSEHRHHLRSSYHPRHCGAVNLTHGTRAISITTENMTCRAGRRLLRGSPSQRYAVPGGRFRHRGFYCGSMGWEETEFPSIFQCALDQRSVTYEVPVRF